MCILRIVTRIMVRTYNCSCNRNMYLWWCSNVYKRLQSFIWRYFYSAFLRFCLGIDSNVQPGGGEIWLHLTGMISPWAGNLIANFWKKSNPHPMPCLPPRRHYIDRCISRTTFSSSLSKTAFGLSCPKIFAEFVAFYVKRRCIHPTQKRENRRIEEKILTQKWWEATEVEEGVRKTMEHQV